MPKNKRKGGKNEAEDEKSELVFKEYGQECVLRRATSSSLDSETSKTDVILKYQPDAARLLKAYGELPDKIRLNEGIAGGLDEDEDGEGDDFIDFEDEDIDRI
ncbi:hypothetical protein AXG93_4003s1250 [Marchantia polymorpha subsp. ruderalis]|uniref:Uncharacterized protein n=1 Tax=Marchantia polymorpha subsp. ruderalis TaxID=1480154 RepID=A0A176WA94_MARPO|nr:hypothetical protein AXG93_4003s1250 [Marchantia polymorpha subsp. ruderalis]